MAKETREQFDARMYLKIDPRPEAKRKEKSGMRRFWFLCVPLGGGIAFFITLLSGSGGAFFPAWGVLSVLLWGMFSEEK